MNWFISLSILASIAGYVGFRHQRNKSKKIKRQKDGLVARIAAAAGTESEKESFTTEKIRQDAIAVAKAEGNAVAATLVEDMIQKGGG